MEEEKKKKKNKKKKNKQAKTTEDGAGTVGGTALPNHNHVVEQSHHCQVSGITDAQNDAMLKADVDLNGHGKHIIQEAIISEAEKLQWLQTETSLEETIKQLQNEKDSYIQKEASLEETIKQLHNEKNSYIQIEACLEMRIAELQHEKNLCLKNEVSLEEKISELLDEKATLNLKVENLEENVKHLHRENESWTLKENSTRETVASLNDESTILHAQVKELEESQSQLFQENQQLKENISGLQLRIQSLEGTTSSNHLTLEAPEHASENEDLYAQIDATRELVGKSMAEKAELVDKMNELYNGRSETTRFPSAVESGLVLGTAETSNAADLISKSNERIYPSGYEGMEHSNVVLIEDKKIQNTNADYKSAIENSLEAIGSGEIVLIPLDENEGRDLESQATETVGKTAVPLSAAPLIGAPFRLISFVAKYVSGADLINKSSEP